MRVYEYAKKLNLSSKEVIIKLKEMNIEVSNHMTTIEDDAVKKLDNIYQNKANNKPQSNQQQVAAKPQQSAIQAQRNVNTRVSLDNLFEHMKQGEMKDLNIIIKADVQGSAEASSVVVENPNVISPSYVFPASVMYSATFVALPIQMGNTPVTSGSKVPVCPILFIFNILRSLKTQSCDVIPLGL